jgi:hypothetical protein
MNTPVPKYHYNRLVTEERVGPTTRLERDKLLVNQQRKLLLPVIPQSEYVKETMRKMYERKYPHKTLNFGLFLLKFL